MTRYEGLPREIIALRVSHEIPENSYVNLGIGIPTLVSNWMEDKDVILLENTGQFKGGRTRPREHVTHPEKQGRCSQEDLLFSPPRSNELSLP